MANEAVTSIVVQTRDEASAGLDRIGASTLRMVHQIRSAALQFAVFSRAIVDSLEGMKLLTAEQAKAVNTALSYATAVAAGVSSVVSLIDILQKLNVVTRIQLVLQAALAALSGVGLARVGLALGVLGVTYVGTKALLEESERASGRARDSENGNITVVNNGVLMGNESDARRLADKIRSFTREDQRVGR